MSSQERHDQNTMDKMEEEYKSYEFHPVKLRTNKLLNKFGTYFKFDSNIKNLVQGDENTNIDINLATQTRYSLLSFKVFINHEIEKHPEKLGKIKEGIEKILGVKLEEIKN